MQVKQWIIPSGVLERGSSASSPKQSETRNNKNENIMMPGYAGLVLLWSSAEAVETVEIRVSSERCMDGMDAPLEMYPQSDDSALARVAPFAAPVTPVTPVTLQRGRKVPRQGKVAERLGPSSPMSQAAPSAPSPSLATHGTRRSSESSGSSGWENISEAKRRVPKPPKYCDKIDEVQSGTST